jgi:hypothetical protein
VDKIIADTVTLLVTDTLTQYVTDTIYVDKIIADTITLLVTDTLTQYVIDTIYVDKIIFDTIYICPPNNSTAIRANNYLPLQICPNPAINGQFTIENGQLSAGDKVEIYNVNGVLTGTYDVSGEESTAINIAHLPAGVYIVKMGNKAAKVVKQ